MSTRNFTCQDCGGQWSTDKKGNFKYCPDCKQQRVVQTKAPQQKTCAYGSCGKSFVDPTPKLSMRYCSEKCRYKAKVERSGDKSKDGFLEDLVRVCENPQCGQEFTPQKSNQVYCSSRCRKGVYHQNKDAKRHKVCKHCGVPFYDDSKKNNRQAHPKCSNRAWGLKAAPPKEVTHSDQMESKRNYRVKKGEGGRLDHIETMAKYTNSWWGRVSEKIYAQYRPDAEDTNAVHGARSPYDFQDIEYGRVDVRGAKVRMSPQGRLMWTYLTVGLQESCDTLFLVGYGLEHDAIQYLWIIPSSEVPPTSIRMAPGSREYKYGHWDVSSFWGLKIGQDVLQEILDLPEPQRPEKFAWMDELSELQGSSPNYKGRRGELLYKSRYPDSKDINREQGSDAPYDFLDPSGVRVNVKSAHQTVKSGTHRIKWSFSLGPLHTEHKCDLYACLCLDEEGGTILDEYRIPATAFGDRRTIHIYESGGQWNIYRAGASLTVQEASLRLQTFDPKDWPSLTPDEQDRWIKDIYNILRKAPFPYPQELSSEALQAEFGKLQVYESRHSEDNYIQPRSLLGLKACYPYFPNRYEAFVGSVSAYESWHREGDLKRAIKYQLRVGDPVLPHRVLRAITMQVRTPTIFRPAVAKFVAEKLCRTGGLVYDPCSGYGGRLLGTLAAGRRYMATDVEARTVEGNKRLAEALGLSSEVELHESPAELFDIPEGEIDLVFTSPPYYTKEWYSMGDAQSAVRHGGSLTDWVGGFLLPMIQKAYRGLKVGGILALNVADVKIRREDHPLVGISLKAAEEVGFETIGSLKMPLASLNRKDAYEPILVFRK